MQCEKQNQDRKSRTGCWGCLSAILIGLVLTPLLITIVRCTRLDTIHKQKLQRWAAEIAAIEAGKRDSANVYEVEFVEEMLQHAICLNKVKKLYFWADLSNNRWSRVSEFPHLKQLRFYDSRNADTFFERIEGQDTIEDVIIGECTHLSSRGLRSIARFPRMRSLHLSYACREIDLEPLRNHRSIEVLTVSEITHQNVNVLETLPKLRKLVIENADTLMSAGTVEEVRKALPNVAVASQPEIPGP